MTRKIMWLNAWLLYGGMAPVLVIRHFGLRYGGADPEASQVALFITFFLISFFHAWMVMGWREAVKLAVLVVTAWWAVELLGLRTGFPFGSYRYVDILGPTVGGVPVIIPLVWFAMFYAARWAAVLCFTDEDRSPLSFFAPSGTWALKSLVLGAFLMTLWDLAMDFDEVSAGRWIWLRKGFWFGIPLSNFAGWFGGAVAIQLLFHFFKFKSVSTSRNQVWPAALFYFFVTGLATLKAVTIGAPLIGIFVAIPLIVVLLRLIQNIRKISRLLRDRV
jgi:uncharacterized membrane protein